MDQTSVNCGTNEMQSTGLCSGHFGEREFACIFMKTEQGISAWSDIEGVAIMINLRGQKSEKFVQLL